jgi:predicted GIY-YIG superfamily endonuclease
MMPLPYCVYILFSRKDVLLYTGFTTDIEQRVRNHNEGKTKSTAPRRPLELVFCEFYLFDRTHENEKCTSKQQPVRSGKADAWRDTAEVWMPGL